jgi:hypothetical protein
VDRQAYLHAGVVLMPYKSEKQRRYMHAKHPEIAKKWDKKYGSKPKPQSKKKKR